MRNRAAMVLAIAAVAMEGFPGLGTLGGGVLHAIAYGLVFDSLGNALAATLAERSRLDAADIETRLRALLAEPARARLERVARLALLKPRSRTPSAAIDLHSETQRSGGCAGGPRVFLPKSADAKPRSKLLWLGPPCSQARRPARRRMSFGSIRCIRKSGSPPITSASRIRKAACASRTDGSSSIGKDWSTARVDVTIDMTSADMGDAKWSEMVRGGQFLDAARWPTARFISRSVEKKDDKTGVIHGDLTFHGTTKPVDVEFTLNRIGND